MATYTQLVDQIRSWSNRDAEILPSATIKQFINFAADNVYRELRIPPLEYVQTYTSDTEGCRLAVPSDAIEFIQLRLKDAANSLTGYTVYGPKSDIRSFYTETTTKYGDHYYTREADDLIVHPNFRDSEVIELYYYRRLPEMDARYLITDTDNATTIANYATLVSSLSASDRANDPDILNTQFTYRGNAYVGNLVPHWLRDQNEKLILFGALAEAFTYLDEPAQAQSYQQRFMMEQAKLANEEHRRQYMGGNIQVHYQSHLL